MKKQEIQILRVIIEEVIKIYIQIIDLIKIKKRKRKKREKKM